MFHMSAYDHASLCMSNSRGLYFEFEKVSPIFRSGVESRKMKNYAGLVYCHPEDAEVEYIEDFKHNYCDL